MTTTSHYQKNPDYYMNIDDCKNRKQLNTNPRYKNFNQTIYTAGDEQQFETYRDRTNGNICIENISLKDNRFKDLPVGEHLDWEKYQNLTAESVDNTFNYMFHKMKKGLFIKIKNGKLDVYLPFSKANYMNEWGDRIKYDTTRFDSLFSFFKYSASLTGRKFEERYFNKNPYYWFGNNCMFRTEYPIFEGDASYTNFQDLFKTLCEERQIPDCEIFLNKRDFPYIKIDSTEPYDAIFEEGTPLISHNYDKYAPILGMVTTDNNADIPIPTWEDWARVSNEEDGKIFDTCRTYNEQFNTPWELKKPIAVFRGSSTGCSTTPETNPRVKLAVLGKNPMIDDSDGLPLIDAGVTQWNLKPRKECGKDYLTVIEIKELELGVTPPLTPLQQSEYKYVINVDGHVSAYRLSLEMRSGSVILLADSKYRMWYRNYIIPYVHYVPVRADLSDLYEKVLWCKANDDKCKEIVINAKKFYSDFLCKDSILDYMQKLLIDLKKHTGTYLYNYVTPISLQIEEELSVINKYNTVLIDLKGIEQFKHKIGRCHGYYKFLERVFNSYGNDLMSVLKYEKQIAESRTIDVKQYSFYDFKNLIIKWNKTVEKVDENIHEVFVSYTYLNEMLIDIPNFVYNFGLVKHEGTVGVLSEYIDGITFEEYIRSDMFNMEDYISILIQLNLSIRLAQIRCGFIHWDLYPLNIMIKKFETPILVEYVFGPDSIYKVETNILPVIIDYGKSHIVYDSKHHGLINMYQMNLFQDSFTMLCTSGAEIIQKRLEKYDLSIFMNIFNWLTNSQYIKNRFNTVRDIRDFLFTTKKYTYILTEDKKDVIKRNPMSFVEFLINRFRYSIRIFKPKIPSVRRLVLSPDTLLKLHEKKDIKSIFSHIRNTCVFKNSIKFFNMFEYFYITRHLNHIMQTIEIYDNNSMAIAQKEYIDTISYMRQKLEQNEYTPLSYTLLQDEHKELYTYKDFYNPVKLLELTHTLNLKDKYINYIQYRHHIVDMILSNNFGGDNLLYLNENFQELIKAEPFNQWAIISDIKTLQFVIKQIIKDDIKNIILQVKSKNKGDNCSDALKTLEMYRQIIKLII